MLRKGLRASATREHSFCPQSDGYSTTRAISLTAWSVKMPSGVRSLRSIVAVLVVSDVDFVLMIEHSAIGMDQTPLSVVAMRN
jgi:hypothetical protein